jgi:DNA-binding response OmpR family regulator
MTVTLRLLWLDPDDSTVASGSQVLVEQGWIVDQARNLVEALDRASRVQYDAIILDLQLPDALGTDAWLCIRTLQPNIIGIMTTSSSSLFDLVRVDSSGLFAYLRKPLSMQDVVNTIVSCRV